MKNSATDWEGIESWRNSLTASMAFTQADLFELEDHLNSKAHSLIEQGYDTDFAFTVAASELGKPEELIPRFREKNKHVLLFEALILAGWGFVAFQSMVFVHDKVLNLVAILSALITRSVPITNTLLIATAFASGTAFFFLLTVAVRWSSITRLKKFSLEKPAGLFVIPLWLILESHPGWSSLLRAIDIAYPGVSLGKLANLTDLLQAGPLLAEGRTIAEATLLNNLTHLGYAQPGLVLPLFGLLVALVLLCRKGISLVSLRRVFFFAGMNMYLAGGLLLGVLRFYLGYMRLALDIYLCLMIFVPILLILIPALSCRCLEKNRFIAS